MADPIIANLDVKKMELAVGIELNQAIEKFVIDLPSNIISHIGG